MILALALTHAHGLPSTFPPQTDMAMEDGVATLGLASTGPSPRRGEPDEANRRVDDQGAQTNPASAPESTAGRTLH